VRRLVALDLPAGTRFVELLSDILDRGDAVLPIDQRLAAPAKARLIEALAPSVVIDANGAEHRRDAAPPTEEDDALVVATSGSTGEPKGVVLSKQAVVSSALATSAALAVDPARDTWLCCLPVGHIGGLAVIMRSLFTGTGLEVHDGFDAAAVIGAAKERNVTLVSLVVTAMRRLGNDASLFRTILLGGSAMPEDLPANAVRTYGMTETGSGVVYDGRPLRDVEMRVVDGEIYLRGPMLLRAYRDGRDPKDEHGWLATGDAGEIDADGLLHVHGRIAELIVSGGEKIWPESVEAVLARHRALVDVGVFGADDPEWGQRVCAAVVLRDGATAPSLEELRDLVKAELGPISAPKSLIVLDELPKSALGKIRRHELRAVAARREER
jgi:O-succinylbenzoic acid--CoA ligase